MPTAYSNVLAEIEITEDILIAVTGCLIGAEVHLGKEDLVPDRNTPLATLQAGEADYTGYVAGALTWLAPSISDDGKAEVVSKLCDFTPNPLPATTNQIYYAWIENGAGILIAAWRVGPPPAQMADATDHYGVVVRLRPGLTGLAVEIS